MGITASFIGYILKEDLCPPYLEHFDASTTRHNDKRDVPFTQEHSEVQFKYLISPPNPKNILSLDNYELKTLQKTEGD